MEWNRDEALYEQFAFIFLNEDYEGEFSQYIDAPFSLHIRTGQYAPDIASLWDKGEDALKKFLLDILSSNISGLQKDKVQFVIPDDKIIVGFISNKEAPENEAFWRSYTFK